MTPHNKQSTEPFTSETGLHITMTEDLHKYEQMLIIINYHASLKLCILSGFFFSKTRWMYILCRLDKTV